MAITAARERVRKSRERKRRGVIPVQVEVLRCASAMVLNADDITSLNYRTLLAEQRRRAAFAIFVDGPGNHMRVHLGSAPRRGILLQRYGRTPNFGQFRF
jgi:hypothetical protein